MLVVLQLSVLVSVVRSISFVVIVTTAKKKKKSMVHDHCRVCSFFVGSDLRPPVHPVSFSGGAKNAAELAIFVSQLAFFAVT